jgi:hypothetical protein
MQISTAGFVLILAAALIWTTGAFLIWRNLKRQEKLIAKLGRMCVQQVPEPPRTEAEEQRKLDFCVNDELSGLGAYDSEGIRSGRPRSRRW